MVSMATLPSSHTTTYRSQKMSKPFFSSNNHISRRTFGTGLLGMAGLGVLAACGSGAESQQGADDGTNSSGSGRTGGTIRVGGYGGPSEEAFMKAIGVPFQEKYGIEVVPVSYGDQNEMLANVQASPGMYDLARCSDFGIFDGIKADLLEPIDTSKV